MESNQSCSSLPLGIRIPSDPFTRRTTSPSTTRIGIVYIKLSIRTSSMKGLVLTPRLLFLLPLDTLMEGIISDRSRVS